MRGWRRKIGRDCGDGTIESIVFEGVGEGGGGEGITGVVKCTKGGAISMDSCRGGVDSSRG